MILEELGVEDLILASASPRRRSLLEAAGVSFRVVPAAIDEVPRPGEKAVAYVRRMAREKAWAVPGSHVLAADTIVTLGDRLLGKPSSPEEAAAHLRALSGRRHLVRTAVARRVGGRLFEHLSTTTVTFRTLSETTISWYLSTREPFDKAGGYGIQGHGAALVASLRGSYSNVVGLPLAETLHLLSLPIPSNSP